MKTKNEVIIIGSGPAGLTAAIYAARAKLNPVVIAGIEYGGQLMGTTLVENFPGFPEGIMGPQLMQNMMDQAKSYGAEMIFKYADKVDFSGDIKKVSVGENDYEAKAVIIATGSSPRKLDVPGEEVFWGKGVSTCATCDAAFYKERVVAVIGGGDSAMEESNFLTKFASKVYILHRREEFRASKIMQDRAFENPKIEVLWNTEVKCVVGDLNGVHALEIHNTKENMDATLAVDGMFLAIGHIPNTKFLEGHIKLDEAGYIIVKDNTHTSVEGVFVAGDVRDHHYQQAITASGMGCMAAMDAEKFLALL